VNHLPPPLNLPDGRAYGRQVDATGWLLDTSIPGDVPRANFPMVRRGYDPIEVQGFARSVAAEIDRLQDRCTELEAALKLAEAKASERMTEATVAGFLGEEAARMLEASRSAADVALRHAEATAERTTMEADEYAATTTADADAHAERVRRETRLEVERLRQEADQYSVRIRREADGYAAATRHEADEYAAATRHEADEYAVAAHQEADEYAAAARQEAETYSGAVRREADAYAGATRERADADAAATHQQALVDAERLVQEAMEHRAVILRELTRRRDLASAQIRSLMAGRDLVVEALGQVGALVAGVSEGLQEIGTEPADFVQLDSAIEGVAPEHGAVVAVTRNGRRVRQPARPILHAEVGDALPATAAETA
jgi:cell division septum initiation protein DivIVA